MHIYQILSKAKTVADDEWFDYTRMPKTYQDDHPQSYWHRFLIELELEGYEIAKREKRPEGMADVS